MGYPYPNFCLCAFLIKASNLNPQLSKSLSNAHDSWGGMSGRVWGSRALGPQSPALRCPDLPCNALPPHPLPCPAPCPALPSPCQPRAALIGGEGQAVCWKPSLFVDRPAQAARTDNPTPIHISSARLCNVVVYVSNGERARKPPLRGVWGVNPKP